MIITRQRFEEIVPEIKTALSLMNSSYEDLQTARKLYKVIDKAYYNVFPGPDEMSYDSKSVDVLRSGFCHSSVEISSRGMRFPDFHVDASSSVAIERQNAENAAKAVLEWVIKESGMQNVYQKSKESWAKYGDAYRRQYARKLPNGKYWPQYERLDPNYLLLDPDATQVWSENTADSASYYGYTQILDERQVIKKYGQGIIEHILPGAMIDIETYATKTGKTKQTNYYELLEITDSAYGHRMLLLGANAFPVYLCVDGKEKPAFPKEIDKFIQYSGVFKTKNKLGEKELDLMNVYFFYDSRGPRNLGLVHKLIPSQYNEQVIENLKSEATRLKMYEIPTVAGGKEEVIDNSIERFSEKRKENLLAVLHAPSNIDNVIPKFDVLRFQGVSAEDAAQTTRDTYDFARNTSGVDLSRLEIQANVTLGQSQLIEQEKIDTLETIILQCKDILEREYSALLDGFILYEGYGQDGIFISYDHTQMKEGMTPDSEPVKLTVKREVDLVTIAKELKEHRLNIIIDDSAMINRTYTTMLDSWIRLLGVIDPASVPDLYKFILQKVGEAGRFTIPEELFKGISQQQGAMGGMSQFKSQPNEQSNQQEQTADPNMGPGVE